MKVRLLPVVFALVVPLAACNGDRNSSKSADTVQSPTSQASPDPQASPNSIVQSPTPTSPTAQTSPSADSASGNWQTYSSTEGNFSAQFPGKPKEQKRSAESPQGTVSGVEASYVDDAKQRLYLTRQVSLPIPPGTKLDKANIEKVLDSGRDNTAKTSGATVQGETKISNSGYPGREFSMTLPNGAAAKVRIFINPDSLKAYQAIVATKAGKVDFPEANTFLESVKISK